MKPDPFWDGRTGLCHDSHVCRYLFRTVVKRQAPHQCLGRPECQCGLSGRLWPGPVFDSGDDLCAIWCWCRLCSNKTETKQNLCSKILYFLWDICYSNIYRRVETTDHVSECLASQIAQLLGLPCAKFELGVYHGREGSMSYNIIQRDSQILVRRNSFYYVAISRIWSGKIYGPGVWKQIFHRNGTTVYTKVCTSRRFFDMVIFDYLIGNTDRHQNNWAIVEENGKMTWSPLYDNSSSFFDLKIFTQ